MHRCPRQPGLVRREPRRGARRGGRSRPSRGIDWAGQGGFRIPKKASLGLGVCLLAMLTQTKKHQAAWQTSPQLYFKRVPGIGVGGWLGGRAAEPLGERPLESDRSELDSQLSVSACVTLDN